MMYSAPSLEAGVVSQPASPPLWTPPVTLGLSQQGVKHDQGKDPWHLFPWDAARGVVKVLGFGASKYAPRNWELGMDWDRPFAACIRHLTAWYEGEDVDPETGLMHLAHASCCCLFLLAYQLRGAGKDTRPKPDAG